MDPRLARRLLLLALAIGLAADVLFDGQALGVNVALAVPALLVAVTAVGRRAATGPIDPLDHWIPIAGTVAAAFVAIRADEPLVLLDSTIGLVAVAAWACAATGRPVTRASLGRVLALGMAALLTLGTGAALVAGHLGIDPSTSRIGAWARGATPAARGILIALPILFVVAALLGSADVVFGTALERLLTLPIDLDEVIRRTLFVSAAAWLALGPLSIAGGIPIGLDLAPGSVARHGATEFAIVLWTLDALLAAFVGVQVAFLFGGADTIAAAGITYSAYAREGYFQLVAVIVLVGGLLLLVGLLGARTRAVVGGAGALIGLTALVLASAVTRLSLYLQAYGWTELRFYVAASIAWLAICGIGAGVLLWRDRLDRLAHVGAIGAVAVTLAISAVGPQAFVAGQNVARAIDPRLVPADGWTGLDVAYVQELGVGAVPVLVDALPRLSGTVAEELRRALELRRRALDLLDDDPAAGWAGWSLDRERAFDALRGLPAR